MNRDSAAPRWRSTLVVALTVLCILALGAVLFQILHLSDEVGIGRAGLQREQLAVRRNTALFNAISEIDDLRAMILNGAPPSAIAVRKARLNAHLRQIDHVLRQSADAELGVKAQAGNMLRAWEIARRPAPPLTHETRLDALTMRIEALMGALEDNSNLGYDRSQIAQNLADVAFAATPDALEAAARVRLLVDMAARSKRFPLDERLTLAKGLAVLRSVFDLTTDSIPHVARDLAVQLPSAHQFATLPAAASAYHAAGMQLYQALSAHVLTASETALPVHLIDARADAALARTVAVHRIALAALLANLDERANIEILRSRLQYAAALIAILVIIGFILALTQLIARRDRTALKESQREAAHLAAELARGEAEEALRLSEAQFRAVFDGAALGIAIVDRGGILVDANSVFRAMYGDDLAAALHGHEDALDDVLAARRETFEFEQHQPNASGAEVWTDVTVSVVLAGDDAPLFAICMFRDKTALKHSERRIAHASTHDALTGLPNRQLFLEHLRRRLQESSPLLESFFAVAFVDLQHFKDVNEGFGRPAGDVVLAQTSQRLRASMGAGDVVARLGNDEFAILIPSLGDILHVESIARRILNNVSKPVFVGSRSISLGANIGIAIGSGSYERAEDVMQDAELAVQHAKTGGSARYAIYDSKMHERAHRRSQLTTDMRLAIERKEFRLLYQPIVNLSDGALIGCEALLRWEHPTDGTINPSEFIPLAEQCGLAAQIGQFVLQTAASQLAMWRRGRSDLSEFAMHVNVSASELLDATFARVLAQCVQEHGLVPADVMLEITESVVLDTGTRANATLDDLRARGFKTCIDDFGTGYSSLRYLQQFKVDAIKIDRGFVSGSDGELASEPIVRTLMTLAAAYDVQVVAEGVETERQRELLRSVGCQRAQGFLFSPPVCAAELVALYPGVLGRASRSA